MYLFSCAEMLMDPLCVYSYMRSHSYLERSVSHCRFILVLGLFSDKSNAYIAEIKCLWGSELLHICSKGVRSLHHWASSCIFWKKMSDLKIFEKGYVELGESRRNCRI